MVESAVSSTAAEGMLHTAMPNGRTVNKDKAEELKSTLKTYVTREIWVQREILLSWAKTNMGHYNFWYSWSASQGSVKMTVCFGNIRICRLHWSVTSSTHCSRGWNRPADLVCRIDVFHVPVSLHSNPRLWSSDLGHDQKSKVTNKSRWK